MNPRRRQMRQPGGSGPWAPRFPVAPREVDQAAAAAEIERGPGPDITRSPLTDTFPVFRSVRGGFGAIPGPNGAFSVPAGQMGVFPLINVRAADFQAQDVLLAAVHCSLGSAEAAGEEGFPGWGNASGFGAAIIVGVNIPGLKAATGDQDSWSAAALPIPYVDFAVNAMLNDDTRYPFCTPFAPGLQGASPSRIDPSENFPPHVWRLKQQDRIQAAFVLNRTQTNNAAGFFENTLRGICEVRIRLGLTFTAQGLERT